MPSDIITHAATSNFFCNRQTEAGTLMKEMLTTPTRAKKIINKWKKPELEQAQLTAEEALSYMIECNLTVYSYKRTRKIAKSHNHNMYPSYAKVLAAKISTYPEMHITETDCVAPLQSLLDKTMERILLSIDKIENKTLVLICKWGIDGSNQTNYKQTFSNKDNKDDSLLCASIVPLILKSDENGDAAWTNPKPSSTRFCRPIQLQWIKETVESTRQLEQNISSQIDQLNEFISNGLIIKYELVMTMVDGKVNKSKSIIKVLLIYII